MEQRQRQQPQRLPILSPPCRQPRQFDQHIQGERGCRDRRSDLERAPQLTPSRQEELANLAQPITAAQGQAGVQRLYGMANWLLGRR